METSVTSDDVKLFGKGGGGASEGKQIILWGIM